MDKLVVALKATGLLLPQAAVLAVKQWQGKETGVSALQRLGISYESRAPGPLIWFHAATIGECAVALPVVFRCLLEYNEKVAVMLTTASVEAYEMLRASLPARVVVQMMPLDNPVCVSLFMRRWRPTVGIFVESPFSPQLVLLAAAYQVKLALINAHIEPRDLNTWHAKRKLRDVLGRVLDKFALIIPQSDVDVGRFRIFGATMKQMPGWCNELKYAALMGNSVWHLWKPTDTALLHLKEALAGRPTWLAANTVHGEEEAVGRLHQQVASQLSAAHQPRLVTVLVPQDSGRCAEVAALLTGQLGLNVAIWSMQDTLAYADMDMLLVDDHRQLPMFYRMCEITLMGNSLVQGCTGHSLAQAAVAGTALLLGPHAGSSEHMAEELNNAAVMAAEDAAAAVRSTGQVMDDNVWEEAPTSPSGSAVPNGGEPGGEDAPLEGRMSAGTRMLLHQHSSSSRPGTAAMGRRSSLAYRLSYLNQPHPDSPRTIVSETDSMCSETSPAQVVRHYYGSFVGTSPSTHLAVSSPSYRSVSHAATPTHGTAATTVFTPRGSVRDSLSPHTSHQPQVSQLHHRVVAQAPGSLPSSPVVRHLADALPLGTGCMPQEVNRHWERVFSAQEDAAPWSETAGTTSHAGTPRAVAAATTTNLLASPRAAPRPSSARVPPAPAPTPVRPTAPRSAPAAAAATARRSPFAASQATQATTAPSHVPPTASTAGPKHRHDASTQTDAVSADTPALSLVMVAAMMGAMGGAQLSQQHAPYPSAAQPAVPPLPGKARPANTFVPYMHAIQGQEASLAGMPNLPLHAPGAASCSPATSLSGYHTPPRALPQVRLASTGSVGSAHGDSACSSPSGTCRSTSFADDPVLESRSQKLKLKLAHSTWTATSTPGTLSPHATAPPAPHSSPSPAFQHLTPPSADLAAALQAVNTQPAASSSVEAAASSKAARSTATASWLANSWDYSDDDLGSGPELSMKSAPLLAPDSFEFSPVSSPSSKARLGSGTLLPSSNSLAARRQPSRLALTSNASPTSSSPAARSGLQTECSVPDIPWSGLSIRAPSTSVTGPAPGLNLRRSTSSSRSSTGLHNSDPGSPAASPPSGRSSRNGRLHHSDSGSPTEPMRVSVAGWMGDLGLPAWVAAAAPGAQSPTDSPAAAAARAQDAAAALLPLPPAQAVTAAQVRGSANASPTRSRGNSLSGAVTEPVPRLSDTGRSRSGSGGLSRDNSGSLRTVRTPRAIEAEPSRVWSGANLPPVSPRASLNPRASAIPPPSPRAPRPEDANWGGASIAELQAMAASYNPDAEADAPQPETPTSRMSVLARAVSPFASQIFDRPNPFALGLPNSLDSVTADTLSDAFMARLARERSAWDTADPEESQPATPTTRLSAMNSVTSPFASNVFDRPNPFAMDGVSLDRAESADSTGTSGSAQPTSGSGSSPAAPRRVNRSPSYLLQQQAAANVRRTARRSDSPLTPLAEANSDSGGSAAPITTTAPPPVTAPDSDRATAFMRSRSRFASQHERSAPRSSELNHDAPLHKQQSAGSSSTAERLSPRTSQCEEPETPRFRPRLSGDLQSAGSSQSSSWFPSPPQLLVTDSEPTEAHGPRSGPATLDPGSSAAQPSASPTTDSPPLQARESVTPADPQQSPLKALPAVSAVKTTRRAAYQVRSAAEEAVAALGLDSTASAAVLNTATATAEAITNLGLAVDAAGGTIGVSAAAAPLSPRSPFRKLFDGDLPSAPVAPAASETASQLPPPRLSADGLESSSPESVGQDLLNCFANAAQEPAGSFSRAADPAERAQLLATTRKLVTALEACLTPADGSPGSTASPTLQVSNAAPVQDALRELLDILGPEVMAQAASGSISNSSSASSLQLDRILSGDLSSASFASLREYSLRVHSLGVAEALDAAVAVAGLAGVVGASAAGVQDASDWEDLLLRVSSAGASVSFSTPRFMIHSPTSPSHPSVFATRTEGVSSTTAAVPLPELTLDGRPASVLCTQLSGRCDMPPDSAPLVVPSVHGPVLMAAPIEIVSRLSHGSFTSRASAVSAAANSMADILSSIPSLPQLRLPSGSATGGRNTVTARATAASMGPGVPPAVTPYPVAPSSAPAHAAYAHASMFGGSSMLPAASGLTASAAGSTETVVGQPQLSIASSGSSTISQFAFGSPAASPDPTASADFDHNSGAVSPTRHTTHHPQPVPLPQLQDPVAVTHAEEAADKGSWPWTAPTAQVPPARPQTPQVAPAGAPPAAAYMSVNPAAALAHKLAGSSGSGAATSSQPPAQTSQTAVDSTTQTRSGGQLSNSGAGQGTRGNNSTTSNGPTRPSASGAQPRPAGSQFVLPATQLSRSTGPAVWAVTNSGDMAGALLTLLNDPLERRSRGHAAAQAAAKLASTLVNTVWHVLDESVITPALHGYVQTAPPGGAATNTQRP